MSNPLEASRSISKIHAFFPLLPELGNRWAIARSFEGRVLGVNLHLTTLSAALLQELALGGAKLAVSAANPATTDPDVVALLRDQGHQVYTGPANRHEAVLEHQPTLLVDVGFDLCQLAHRTAAASVVGAVEITRTGIRRLRETAGLRFPVVNINDGQLKNAVENRHGVGEALWQAVCQLTGLHLAGRRVLVVGYGPVGVGVARYARAAGMAVEVCESDPIRRLFAHYDGYPTPTAEEALQRVGFVVTATGRAGALPAKLLADAGRDLILANAGHGADEIDVVGLEQASVSLDQLSDQVSRHRLKSGRLITLLGGGNPLNIVVNSGSPEPVLLHFAVLGMALEWLAEAARPAGEIVVPAEVEARAAQAALAALP